MQHALSPEYRLLTRAAAPVAPATADPPSTDVVDWRSVVRLARRHRLGPRLARHLESDAVDAPEAVAAELTRERRHTAAANLRLTAGATVVLDALARADVPAMPLKGLVLLDQVYHDISLRPMVDVDLLVREESIQRAEDIVVGLGFSSARPPELADPGLRRGKYAYPELRSADGLVRVDLHRHVLPDARFDIEQFWTHARPGGEGVHLAPDREDLVIHLAAHFFKDRVRRSAGSLGQLSDVAWTAHAAPVDWDVVVARARSYGLAGRVFLALVATNELVAPVVPEEVLAALRPRTYSPSVGRTFVKRRLLGDGTWAPPGYFRPLPGAAFGPRWRPLRRVLPDRAYLEASYGARAGPGSSYARLLFLRARRAASWARPWTLVPDARLNRWMRSVADEGVPRATKA